MFSASSALIHCKPQYSSSSSTICHLCVFRRVCRPWSSSRQGDGSGSEGFADLGFHPGLPHHAGAQTGWEGRGFLSIVHQECSSLIHCKVSNEAHICQTLWTNLLPHKLVSRNLKTSSSSSSKKNTSNESRYLLYMERG